MVSAGLPEHDDRPSAPISDSTAAAMTLGLRTGGTPLALAGWGPTRLRGTIGPTAAGCFAYPMVVRSGWRSAARAAPLAQASRAPAWRPARPPPRPARRPAQPRRPWWACAG